MQTAAPAAAEEIDAGRLRPVSRGGRQEVQRTAPAEPAVVVPAADPAPAPPPAPVEPPLSQRIAGLAANYIGTAYTFGGTNPATGFDCSGFVQWVLSNLGINVGRVVTQQYQSGTPIPIDALQPGDVVFFANTYMPGLSHVGIYVGDGQFIDAGTERTGVRRASLYDAYWSSRYVGARRMGE